MQKPEQSRPILNSLIGRMVLTSIVPATLVIAAIVSVNAYRKYDLMLDSAKGRLVLQAEGLATWVEASNQRTLATANALRTSATELFGQRETSMGVQRSILESNPWATGAAIGYEPGADGNDAAWAGKPLCDAGGRFLPYVFRDWKAGRRVGWKILSGYETDEWYQGPLARFRKDGNAEAFITEPYDYEGILIVTGAAPIVRGEKVVGVISIDVELATIQEEVNRRASALGVDIYLVTQAERIVVASDGSGREFASDPSGWGMKMLDQVPAGPALRRFARSTETGRVESLHDPNTGDTSFFATARIGSANWTLVMAVPEATVTGPIIADTSVTAGLAAAGIALIVGIMFLPTRSLARRVDAAASAAQQVAAGDLTRPASGSTCPDETGDLLRALDSMTADLNSLVGQVRGASVELSTTAAELSATSRQQDEVVASFGASSAEIAAAVREINTTSQELSREMEHVNEVATATARLAQDGRVQLESMEGAMQSLDKATAGVADRLAAINEKAVNIGGVVTTITKVAEQTNLLSVNAAIEAEKAGEYGRGFLVVAREIRRLADQTGQATLDIERMVKEMQGAVSSGVMEMDRFSDQVRRNVTDVRTIGRSMTDIIGSVDETSRSFGTVREGMRSQAAGAGQISEAMASLSSNAKATADAVREFGRAADDLQRSIGTLRAAIAAFQLTH
jgi:methyl-accepting chemotaxis protein